MHPRRVEGLTRKATRIRHLILQAAHRSGRLTHPGPALSIADLCTAIYFGFMKASPDDPTAPDRDRFVLSKGHAALAQYACLAELGYYDPDELSSVRHLDSRLQGHPTLGKTPGVDMTTGSLGNGLGAGLGMARYLKDKGLGSRVFVLLGDGEMNEGTVWEAVALAPALRQDSLIVVIDQNHFQSGGTTENILPMQNLPEIMRSFGWKTFEVNGHDMAELASRLEIATNYHGAPVCLVAHTVKGKGVSFMEHNNAWHQRVLSQADYQRALTDLEVEE